MQGNELCERRDGTNTSDLNTETQSKVDLGGATLAMNINVAGSLGSGTVTSTLDSSTFTPTDGGHQHIVPEHETQDVHFPATETEDSVEIEIYPRLAVGDVVLLFAFNNFQRWYVAVQPARGMICIITFHLKFSA